jgi:hypothetical protein
MNKQQKQSNRKPVSQGQFADLKTKIKKANDRASELSRKLGRPMNPRPKGFNFNYATMLKQQRKGLLAAHLDNKLGSMTKEQQAIARTIIDPAHLIGTSNGPVFPDDRTSGRVACRVQVQETVLSLQAGQYAAVYSIPFLECPYAYKYDDGNTVYAVPNRMLQNGVNNPRAWLKNNNVYGYRTTGKSLSIHNITPEINKGGQINCARFPPQVDFKNASPSGTTLAGGAADATTAINIKVLQALPGSVSEISTIPTFQTYEAREGCYMVNKLLNEDWILRTDSMSKGYTTDVAPATTDANGAVAFVDMSAEEGTNPSYLLYTNAAGGYVNNSVATAGKFDGTDVTCAILSAPAGVTQTYLIRMVMVTEFIPKLNSSTFMYELKDRSQDMEFMRLVRRFASEELGIYPVSFNDWSSVFNKLKGWFAKGRDFYKSNASILRPALGLIPGAATALDIVDKYI